MLVDNLTRLAKPILWVSFLLSLILSWSLLSGDSVGKVNLLYLLILFVLIPIITLVFSLLSMVFPFFRSSSISSVVASFILNNHIVFTQYKSAYLKLYQSKDAKLVFFYFSQMAAMSFSIASLLVLFILLLTTDVHFVWRSTLLNSQQILSILQSVSAPWFWWETAQPTLELITNSQDDRVTGLPSSMVKTNHDWWKFVLATQLFYAFLLRFVVLFALKVNFRIQKRKLETISSHHHSAQNDIEDERGETLNPNPNNDRLDDYESLKSDTLHDYSLNNWATCSEKLLTLVEEQFTGNKLTNLNAGPSASDIERLTAERWQDVQIILVKSWEPPLAELADFMDNTNGYILPIDFKDDLILPIKPNHLVEWNRFCHQHTKWELILPQIARPAEASTINSNLVNEQNER
ncbi:MAG: DUF2868 domain-containing protein [Kangiellaceae bacterium]